MKFRAGTIVGIRTVYMPKEVLTESVPGAIYELRIKTKGVSNPKNAMVMLAEALWDKFKAKLYYFEVSDNIITMQIEGSPFAWALLLVFLPEILVVLGIIVLLILVYLVTSAIPSWQLGLAAVALALIFLGPGVISKVAMMKVKK